MTISNDSIVVAVKSQVSREVDAETVVLHVDKGVYFGLNEVATLIWNQLQKPRKVQEIRDAILHEYEVPMSNASANCSRYLENSPKMVHIRDATAT